MPGTDVKIKWESLPKQYQTKENKNFYDKDGDGWINQCNKNGQNEIELMEKGLNLKSGSLMQYALVHNEDGSVSGPNGRAIRYGVNLGRTNLGEGNTYHIVDSIFNSKGRLIYTSDDFYDFYDSSYDKEHKFYEEFQLTKGKYNLVRKIVTQFNSHARYSTMKHICTMSIEDIENHLAGSEPFNFKVMKEDGNTISDEYYLNGEKVKAKAIGGGRYEVTKQDGIVIFISHDGHILKPEYVANNPKKLKKQKPTMGLD